jgi:hypothetical protein
MTIGLPADVADAVAAAAYRENRSRAKVIEQALRQVFNLPRTAPPAPRAPKRGRRAQPLRLSPAMTVVA